jgi:hypothetical protein
MSSEGDRCCSRGCARRRGNGGLPGRPRLGAAPRRALRIRPVGGNLRRDRDGGDRRSVAGGTCRPRHADLHARADGRPGPGPARGGRDRQLGRRAAARPLLGDARPARPGVRRRLGDARAGPASRASRISPTARHGSRPGARDVRSRGDGGIRRIRRAGAVHGPCAGHHGRGAGVDESGPGGRRRVRRLHRRHRRRAGAGAGLEPCRPRGRLPHADRGRGIPRPQPRRRLAGRCS